MNDVWQSRHRLPHFDIPGLIQHITFHLADSLPKPALERMRLEIQAMPESDRGLARRRRIQELLDSGFGRCLLAEPACAQIVQDSFLFGDGQRYRLFSWVIMPNHVHVLIEQIAGWPLAKVIQSWKRHTARAIHRLAFGLESSNPGRPHDERESADCKSAIPGLWQRDYWDRYIRNEQHFETARHYIEENPVAAGLVTSATAWAWGSARFKDQQ